MNATAPRAVGRLHDPRVALGVGLLDPKKVRVELVEFVGQDVSIWNEIVLAGSKLFLGSDIVVAQSIFSRYFVTLREMVNPLVLVQAFIQK
jgi:hypothetical protein